MQIKSLSGAEVEVKDADKGLVSAIISTFGVIDKDGDVTSKSTFTEGAPVLVSAYGHGSWEGALPVGRGALRTTDNEAIADLQFNLKTEAGRETFETIKFSGSLQEWSYSLEQSVSKRGELDGMPANFIESTFVKEVSPVIRGASIGTRSLSVKAETKFSEHMDIALRDVKSLVEMALERLPLRAEQGKSITEQTDAFEQLTAALAPLKQAIDGVTQPTPVPDEDAQREWLRSVRRELEGALR